MNKLKLILLGALLSFTSYTAHSTTTENVELLSNGSWNIYKDVYYTHSVNLEGSVTALLVYDNEEYTIMLYGDVAEGTCKRKGVWETSPAYVNDQVVRWGTFCLTPSTQAFFPVVKEGKDDLIYEFLTSPYVHIRNVNNKNIGVLFGVESFDKVYNEFIKNTQNTMNI